ncbi:MAG: AAA family ATPase [Ignavibacteriaceae bacterium]|nr:AAA family ATPase [Ignavibacteriaceae bacterium]
MLRLLFNSLLTLKKSASFGGFQGSGKTRTATEFIIGCYKDMKLKKPALILDNEKGSRFLIPIFKKAGIEAIAKDSTHLKDIITAFDFLNKGEIDFLFIDSLTKIYYRFIKDYKLNNKKQRMTLQDWGTVLPAWQEEFSDRFVEVEGNVCFTGRAGFEYEKEEDEQDSEGNVTKKGQFVKSGVKMKIAGETPYETDLNVWMQLEKGLSRDHKPTQKNVSYILKDRSDTINGKIFEMPSYKNFRPVVRFIQGLPVDEVAGATFTDNLTPGNDLEWMQRNLQRKIEVEKIQGVFDLYGLGDARSKADKQLKAALIKKVFGTTSSIEIEKMDAHQLSYHKEQLEELMKELANAQPEDPVNFINSIEIGELDLSLQYEKSVA